ncbi:hypothetical protein HUG17_2837 [Dermatophagoides farinae]|uniref:Uncharacterized protein n=1 Tax=Dermatophagoides farinae TaxID=6954 RepID=A0A9D4NUA9_DERFA|nr:hypothetical protein HUG17_2837 [Dermatophagoides farinae]
MKHIFHQFAFKYLMKMNNNNNDNDFWNGFIEILVPPILLCTTIGLSTFSRSATIIFLILLLPLSLLLFDRFIYYGRKHQTNFFISWAISSFLILLSVFEFIVVPFLEITIWENYSLLSMVTIAILMLIYLRKCSKNHHSHDNCIDELIMNENNNNHHHHHHHHHDYRDRNDDKILFSMNDWCKYCHWIGATIHGWNGWHIYLASHVCLIFALLFDIYLNITTICHTTYTFNDIILIPDDCSEVYFDINLSLSFITAIYAGQLVILLSYSLLKLLLLLLSTTRTSSSPLPSSLNSSTMTTSTTSAMIEK